MPARVIMQDFTGVPAVVDLAAMRTATHAWRRPYPHQSALAAELVIDHRAVDEYGHAQALARNNEMEFSAIMSATPSALGAQSAFRNLAVVPPDTGIVHQVNLEHLARVVFAVPIQAPRRHAGYPDTLVVRLAHHHDQRPGRAGLGRGRHRSRGRHAGQPIRC